MGTPPLHIVANTSSSNEAFSRRTNELSRFINTGNRNDHLTLIRTHPQSSKVTNDDRVTIHTIPLLDLLGTEIPTEVYKKSRSLEELRFAFGSLIDTMEKIVKDANVVLLDGTYFVPWCLLQAARRQCKPVVLCYAGLVSMEMGHLPSGMQETLRLMEKDFSDPNIHYIFPSTLTKSTVERIFGHELPNSEVIYNGVGPEFLDYEQKSKKDIDVAFVGRTRPVKNPEFLVELAGTFNRLGLPYLIHMVTNVESNNRLISDLRRAGIVISEPLTNPELARFYGSTNVVISPSRFETYGNVPLEAVSVGTPALVSPSMGICEVFDTLGIGNYVTTFDDPYAVAHRIDELIRKQERVPESVRNKIRAQFSWPKIIARYLAICSVRAVY